MTQAEAKKVIAILKQADGGCPWCAADQLSLFKTEFKSHSKLISAALRKVDRKKKSALKGSKK